MTDPGAVTDFAGRMSGGHRLHVDAILGTGGVGCLGKMRDVVLFPECRDVRSAL